MSFGDQMTVDWFVAGVDGDPTEAAEPRSAAPQSDDRLDT